MSDAPQFVIDTHTHLFNVRYLPIRGVLLEFMGKSEVDPDFRTSS